MKRNFVSHIKTSKNEGTGEHKKTKKDKTCVEALVESCYLSILRKMIEESSCKECNGCQCSYEEKIELFYKRSISKLMTNNDEVIEKFKTSISTLDGVTLDAICPFNDVINAENMLKCNVHREKFCTDNVVFLKEKLLLLKC